MAETQAQPKTPAGATWAVGIGKRLCTIFLVTGVIGWLLLRSSQGVGHNEQPVGFLHGVWHGALMPCALPSLLVGRDLNIYAANNNGRAYKLGYTVGVNGCGLLFFGFLFWRLTRWRKGRQPGSSMLAKPRGQN